MSPAIKILVVDDHQMVAESLVNLLNRHPSISVTGAASNAIDALRLAGQEQPDVVLMDYQLPHINGAKATQMFRDAFANVKIIMLAGGAYPGAYRDAMAAGASAWVRKTTSIHDLVGIVLRVYRGEVVHTDELVDLPPLTQLTIHYQPIVRLADEWLCGFEALVRWDHPTRGLVGPDEFIPQAEKVGFIAEIGAWVCRQATQQLALWQRQFNRSPRLWVSVNISASDLVREDLTQEIAASIADAGIDAGDLVIEITESVIQDAETSLAGLARLKALGIVLSLDDFGMAFSSLSSLNQFPFDQLKIDRSFVAELTKSSRAKRLIQGIDDLGSNLGLAVVAEGIETAAQADMLRQIGLKLGQGYFYSRPIEPAACKAIIRTPVWAC